MLLQFQDLPDLWRVSRIDFVRVAPPLDGHANTPASTVYMKYQLTHAYMYAHTHVFVCARVQVVWLVTWLSVVVLNVDLGLAIGVIFSMMTVICRTQR